jgi:hypothetical protein
MSVYVVEIAGRAVVVLEAADESEAKAVMADSEFRKDLRVFQSGGQPLWDGASQLRLRAALEPEASAWKTERRTAMLSDDRNYSRAFLVRVVDPTSFDDDYDNDPD